MDKLLEKCRFGVYVDAVILRTFGDELPGKWFLGLYLYLKSCVFRRC